MTRARPSEKPFPRDFSNCSARFTYVCELRVAILLMRGRTANIYVCKMDYKSIISCCTYIFV